MDVLELFQKHRKIAMTIEENVCEEQRTLSRLRLASSLQRTVYEYQDEQGIVRWRKIRDNTRISNKNRVKSYFVQYIDDEGNVINSWKQVQPPPFNLPKLQNPKTKVVYIVEGEKCAVALQKLLDENNVDDSCATTFCNGLASTKEILKHFRLFVDKDKIVICADNDEPGLRSATLIYNRLTSYGAKNAVLVDFKRKPNGEDAPATYDVADMIQELESLNSEEQLRMFLEYVQKERTLMRDSAS